MRGEGDPGDLFGLRNRVLGDNPCVGDPVDRGRVAAGIRKIIVLVVVRACPPARERTRHVRSIHDGRQHIIPPRRRTLRFNPHHPGIQ